MSNQNETPEAINVAAFDDVISTLRAGRTSHPLHTSKANEVYDGGSYRINPGEVVVLDENDSEALAGQMARSDSNTDFRGTAQALDARVAWLDEQLGRGGFNSATGERVNYIEGPAREALMRERAQAAEEANLARRAAALRAEYRAAEQQRRDLIDEADVIAEEYHRHDPVKKAALEAEIAKLEAAEVARQVLLRRYATRLG